MIWYQYTTADGLIQASNSVKVSDDDLAALGRAQIESATAIDITAYKVDITQDTPIIVPIG